MEQTMQHWLTKQAELSPNKIAIETDETTMTFQELKVASEIFAKKLVTLGVQKQSTVAILSTNHSYMPIAIHALSYLKATIVLLNPRLTKRELEFQLTESNTQFVIITEKLRAEKNLKHAKQKSFTEIETYFPTPTKLATHICLSDPFTMMFTSGTTGTPKAVVHTYGNHWWSAIGSILNLGLHEADKWLLTLPMFHVGGLSILLRSVIYGISVYLMERYEQQMLYAVMKEKRITIASLVTIMLRDLLHELGDEDLPSHVRCLLLGGGAVPEPILKQVEKKQIPVFQSYGMTETSSQIVTLSASDALRKLGSSGKALFPAEVKINEPDQDGIGEICVKGPMVINGYFNNELANKKSFKQEWLKTGDLGYIDTEGFLYVVDRRSDLIISGGENIYPSEIENVLLEMEEIKEVAVVGKEDDVWGQIPVAFIVPKHSDRISKEKVLHYITSNLATYKIPKDLFFVHSLPKNASNKIMRHKLVKQLKQ